MALTAGSHPRLWRLARLDFDRVRQRRVLLYPEGAMFINDTGKAILELCDGTRTLAQISTELSTRYASDVTVDVTEYLTTMFDRDLVTVADH